MVKWTFSGGTELAAALAKLSLKVGRSVVQGALVEAAEPMRADMAAKAPRSDEAPHIADHIGISRAQSEDGAPTVAIGPVKGFGYGVPLEIGTVDTAAQPFARPAYDGNEARSLRIVGEALWRELAGKGIGRATVAADDGAVEAPGGSGLL